MIAKAPIHHRPDVEWSDMAADLAAVELIAGNLITDVQFDFAKKIIAQQIHVLLMTGVRPIEDEISN